MAHYNSRYRYNAYDALGGQFPANLVIMYYKGLAITKATFKAIDKERTNAV